MSPDRVEQEIKFLRDRKDALISRAILESKEEIPETRDQ